MNITILIEQLLAMFLLASIGFGLFKFKIFSNTTIKELTDFLLKIVTFFIITNSFYLHLNYSTLNNFTLSLGYCLLINVIYYVISFILDRFVGDIASFSASFTNASFIGIPLVIALFGDLALLYLVPFIVVQQIGMWTFGIYLLSKHSDLKTALKQVLFNPATLACVVGVILAFFQINLPNSIKDTMSYIANLNTPVAMLILGTFIAQMRLKDFKKIFKLLSISSLRLIIFPLITLVIFLILPSKNDILVTTLIIATGAPIPVSTSLFALKLKKDVALASALVTISSVLSIVSYPIVILIAQSLNIITH